jgi:hypothetical protein
LSTGADEATAFAAKLCVALDAAAGDPTLFLSFRAGVLLEDFCGDETCSQRSGQESELKVD